MTNTVPALSRALVGAGARFPIDAVLRVAAESLVQPASSCTQLLVDVRSAAAACVQPSSAACAGPCHPGTLRLHPRTPTQPWPQTSCGARGPTSSSSSSSSTCTCTSASSSSSSSVHGASNPNSSSSACVQPMSAHDPGRQHGTHEQYRARHLHVSPYDPAPCPPVTSICTVRHFSTGPCRGGSSGSGALGAKHRGSWGLAACINPAGTSVMEHHHGTGWTAALPGWRRAVSTTSSSSSSSSTAKTDKGSPASQGGSGAGARQVESASRPPAGAASAEAVPGLSGTSPEEEISFVQVGRPVRVRLSTAGTQARTSAQRQPPSSGFTPAAAPPPTQQQQQQQRQVPWPDATGAGQDVGLEPDGLAQSGEAAAPQPDAGASESEHERIPMVPPPRRQQPALSPRECRQLWRRAEEMAAGGQLVRLPVGRQGLTRRLLAQAGDLLERHQLLRVYLLPNCTLELGFVAWVAENALDCAVINTKGRTVTLYREHGLPRPAASLREDPGIGMAPQRSLSGAAVGAADGREAAETDVADAGSLGQGMQEQARSTPPWLVVRFRKAARLRETHRFRLMIPRQG